MAPSSKADKKAAIDAAAWMFNVVTSVGIIIVNKALMATYGFSFATTLTGLHFLTTTLMTGVLRWLGYIQPSHLPISELLKFVLFANFSIVGMNVSLMLNSVGFYQIAKLSMIPVSCLLEVVLDTIRYSRDTKLSILVVLMGVAVCTVTDVSVNGRGFLAAFIAVCSTSMQQYGLWHCLWGELIVDQTRVALMEMGMLSGLLRVAWTVGIFPILIAFIPSTRLDSVREIISGFAQRGKIMQSSSTRFTVPQKFFCHFYVVGVLWTTLLLVANWCYAYRMAPYTSEPMLYSSVVSYLTGSSDVWKSVFLLLLMEAQVLRRFYETIYIFKYSPSARMHIFGYLTGIYFYTAAPLSLCCTSAPEVFKFATNWIEQFTFNGKNQMTINKFNEWGIIVPLIRQRWYTWIGAGLFSWGWVHQRRCHAILGMLRKNKTQAEAYVVPEGDWFNHVSSPHYLAEIVIYGGLLVASGCSDLTIWLLFAFVVANLLLAAAETHRWYLHKFEDYPSHRLAIIPFVY